MLIINLTKPWWISLTLMHCMEGLSMKIQISDKVSISRYIMCKNNMNRTSRLFTAHRTAMQAAYHAGSEPLVTLGIPAMPPV